MEGVCPDEGDDFTEFDEGFEFFAFFGCKLPVVVTVHENLEAAIGDRREPERGDSFHEMKRGLDERAHENPCT
jgi:hypothetical protein